MGIMIFLVCVLLKNVEIQMGMVLGLFAIFSILRFRTYNFSTKDMSYLFAVIGLSAINAMLDFPRPILGTTLFNVIIILAILGLELYFKGEVPDTDLKNEKKKKKKGDKKSEKKGKKKKASDSIQLVYDNLPLLNPERTSDLLADLSARTGKRISEVKIRRIDLVNGTAELRVYPLKKAEVEDL
jgi:predicted membrane protein